jgi:hypothetical protein
MAEPERRRFTLGDVMIVVAATAVGMGLVRLLAASQTPYLVFGWPSVMAWALRVAPFLLVAPFAVLALRFRRPRPPARRVFRQPGTVACLAVVMDMVISFVLHLVRIPVRLLLGPTPFVYPIEYFLIFVLHAGGTVAIAWIVLALARAWRPEASWVDRAGRGLGVVFVVVWLLVSTIL